MKKYNIKDFFRGWFIGNFEPTVLKTSDFEIGLLLHPRGEKWPKHYHRISTEYNLLVEGSMVINGVIMTPGDIFVIETDEIAEPVFLEDCKIMCVKVPSIPGDKYEVI